ncbi:unnamed protein product [Alopecurus aequalis]
MESIVASEEEAQRLYMASFIKFQLHSDSISRIPPTRILRFPDVFEDAWGWESILPRDHCRNTFYLDYLKEYHRRNGMDYVAAAADHGTSRPEHWPQKARPVDDVTKCIRKGNDALTAAARFCLDMERKFMSEWKDRPVRNVKLLSQRIQERVCYIICIGREFSEPAAASLVCIANEATLAFELLRHGAKPTDKEFILCNYIRQCALSLMYIEGPYSDASAAAIYGGMYARGVAKEAKKMREWMVAEEELFVFGSYNLFHKMGLCDSIRPSTYGANKYMVQPSWFAPLILSL